MKLELSSEKVLTKFRFRESGMEILRTKDKAQVVQKSLHCFNKGENIFHLATNSKNGKT